MTAYTDLLVDASKTFHQSGLNVTVAIHAGQTLPPTAYQSVDRVHLMAYDMPPPEGEGGSRNQYASINAGQFLPLQCTLKQKLINPFSLTDQIIRFSCLKFYILLFTHAYSQCTDTYSPKTIYLHPFHRQHLLKSVICGQAFSKIGLSRIKDRSGNTRLRSTTSKSLICSYHLRTH